ncbi:hypothetical protein VP01_922g2 [Puccinia sorghi]|uniref:Uncharacterized protein n=1 Tax=Puccinia sorghi TaxID=27349 RepID=A0A0L6U790_9BASI|nr:hypothetical protein VP01_922g2 [Puccinia sorghi]
MDQLVAKISPWSSQLSTEHREKLLVVGFELSQHHDLLQQHPPSVRPLPHNIPNICMLEVTLDLENSLKGVGEVITGLIKHLNNILCIPGAAHKLWNIAQAIFLFHWRDEKHCQDTGAWCTLHALGIPADKPKVYTKLHSFFVFLRHKTFSLLTYEQVDKRPLGIEPIKLPARAINRLVEKTYGYFCSDLGKPMFMWKRWKMSQAPTKLPHYYKHLPELIFMIKKHFKKKLAQPLWKEKPTQKVTESPSPI